MNSIYWWQKEQTCASINQSQEDHKVLSDQTLCQLFRETQQQEILVELLDRYDRYLIALALPFMKHLDSVGDFKMELYLHLYQMLQTSKPAVFKHWLGRIARNKLCDMAKKHKPLILETLPDQQKDSPKWDMDMDFELVKQAVEELHPEQKEYIEMAFFQGYKQREIKEEKGWPVGKARKVRQNAIRNLQKKLGTKRSDFLLYLRIA